MISEQRKTATNKSVTNNITNDLTNDVTYDVTVDSKLTPVQSMAKLIEMDLEKKRRKRKKIRSR